MTTTDHTGDLLKAIQDLSKQVQSIGNGYRGYRNNNSFRNANQQQTVQTTQGRPNQVDKPPEEETIIRTIQSSGKSKQPIRSTGVKKVEPKKVVKKKSAAVAPIYKMVEPYTPQQFFDQKANITNGQLLAMNPKFGLTVAKQLRKPVVRTKIEEQDKKPVKKDDEIPNNGNVSEVEDLMQVANIAGPNDDQTSAFRK
ncbi:unnamed protein product [Rhizophagus irregularis]|nr:unnamed protein product [Rhizophagus irregularis]